MSNAKGGKVESYSRVKDGNGRLAQGEDEARKIWKEYFEDLYNIVNCSCTDGKPQRSAGYQETR